MDNPIIKEVKKIEQIKQAVSKVEKQPINGFKDLYARLSVPMDKKYIIPYNEDGKVFNGLNTQGAIDRLNEVVGLENWTFDCVYNKQEIIGEAWAISADVTITIKVKNYPDIIRTGSGGLYAKRIGDAYKGARTSAFKNACKYLGIGKEIYLENLGDEIDIPKEPQIVKQVIVPEELSDIAKKILSSQTIEELQLIEPEIKDIKEKDTMKLILMQYNAKKIELLS